MFAIVDCNNFFVSCERVFQPELRHKAVVVLSNNDGCVVARSNEAKAMGIKMGQPFFQVKNWVDTGQLLIRSSNYVLYGDMSRRVFSVVARHAPRMEQYSIDECFIDLTGMDDAIAFGKMLAKKVERWTGIPVSIGIAPTKTLAKVASRFAKKYTGYEGCCMIDTEEKRVKALQLTEVGDVWGIGRRTRDQLQQQGVRTAYDFSLWSSTKVRRTMALPGVQTWHELNGRPTLPIKTPAARKTITSSRSFRHSITDFDQLHAAIADFAVQAASQLRKEHSAARTITVFISTDRFNPDVVYYHNACSVQLEVSTSDMREIAAAAKRGLEAIFRPTAPIKKAGVWLSDIEHEAVQQSLFDKMDRDKQERLLQAIDNVRNKNGKQSIRLAAQSEVARMMRREHLSQRYTTDWNELLVVK